MGENEQTISEGLAKVKTSGNVFYNPVQEFNRDLRLGILQPFKYHRYVTNRILRNLSNFIHNLTRSFQ